jgi:uncharacterized membrane protein
MTLVHIVAPVASNHIVAPVASNHIVATVTLANIVAFDIFVAFVISLVALLTSSPVMWLKERLWNVSVLQRVHLSSLV